MGQPDRIPPARFSSPWSRGEGWDFFGCRHGLALLICRTRSEAVVWDPLSGQQRRVAFPPGFRKGQGKLVQNAAVMCAAAAAQDGHVHGDCRFTSFRFALVGGSPDDTHVFACLYDSESSVWGEIVSVETAHTMRTGSPNVLVSDAFCWVLSEGDILEFDFQSQSLAVTQRPAEITNRAQYWSFFAVRTEHGGLGLAYLLDWPEPGNIQFWERKSNCHGVVGWELRKIVHLSRLFSQGPTRGRNGVFMQGYDEDTNAIFLSTSFGDYMLQLESKQFINLFRTQIGRLYGRTYYPYRNFYITGNPSSLCAMTPLVLELSNDWKLTSG
jgi:hypothetical protein